MFDWLIVKLHNVVGLSEDFRGRIVESIKRDFQESLRKVEAEPLNETVVSESYNLGLRYEQIAEDLEIDIKSSRDGMDRTKEISVARYRGLHKNQEPAATAPDELNTDEIMIAVGGNWANDSMTLTQWIEKGPGIRFLRSPYRAWNLRTGEELRLDKIPIQFRNDEESRRKIENGEIPDPWNFETDY